MAADLSQSSKPMTMRQYRALADFRYELRRFLRYSEELTRRHGVTPLQYQLLLQVKGHPTPEQATIGALAERLQAKHHGAVALISRCEDAALVTRRVSDEDRRAVVVKLTAKGERLLERLARLHRNELMAIQGRILLPDLRTLE
jgi:DNA-binding MarR family transcriptional regulator